MIPKWFWALTLAGIVGVGLVSYYGRQNRLSEAERCAALFSIARDGRDSLALVVGDDWCREFFAESLYARRRAVAERSR